MRMEYTLRNNRGISCTIPHKQQIREDGENVPKVLKELTEKTTQPEVEQLREVRNLFLVILVDYFKGEWELSRNYGNHNVEGETHTTRVLQLLSLKIFFPARTSQKRKRARGSPHRPLPPPSFAAPLFPEKGQSAILSVGPSRQVTMPLCLNEGHFGDMTGKKTP